MSEIVVVSGNPRPGSRTQGLATSVAEVVARREGTEPPVVVDLAAYGPALLLPDEPGVVDGMATVRAARILVVATPTYKGSYTGLLKVFLDRLPHQGLTGVVALPITVGTDPEQAAQSQRHLRGLLAELGAEVRPGLAVPESTLGDPDLAAGYAATLPIAA
ncbi:NAD(P)H-dependent oxidoreductase [Plantactinospora veratri]|uniref:NAD(P)H-dependent oxidoreductase n=1 Tax=Plantactinospora veratri TaxID=1436122 RepID=A0ABU7SDW1_9ACTN